MRIRKLCSAAAGIGMAGGALVGMASAGGASSTSTTFPLFVNPGFAACVGAPGGPAPTASVTVVRGAQNDTLTIKVNHVKAHLGFDLFTVQKSPQNPDGTPAAGFSNFGMAWYQSDVDANDTGSATVTVKTVLLDQIFGFDPAVGLAPTNTFHVGLWFDSPAAATACGFTGFTPFNGNHHAGPLAFVSRPNAQTKLGPLCVTPNLNTSPVSCKP